MDDYTLGEQVLTARDEMIVHTMRQGRPVQAALFMMYNLDNAPEKDLQNRLIRLFQGALHVLVGLLVADLLWRETRNRLAYLSIVTFIIWPFNSEAVLWQAANIYPIAAFLGVAGLWIMRRSTRPSTLALIAGISLIVLAMLTGQGSAVIGIVIWVFIIGFGLWRDTPLPMKRLYLEGTALFLGYFAGGVISYLIAQISGGSADRAKLTTDIVGKTLLLLFMNRQYLIWPGLYPIWLSITHLILIGMWLPVIILSLREDKSGRWRTILAVACMLTAVVTPYLILPHCSREFSFLEGYVPGSFANDRDLATVGSGSQDLDRIPPRSSRAALYDSHRLLYDSPDQCCRACGSI
ncbi:MAG: hypothetical protein EXR62_04475 [Chloroflexi bacterium]|nr:hypothetical protein [Chloroflexota bacterium]